MDTSRASFFARNYDRSLAKLEERCLYQRRQQLLAGVFGEVLEVGAGTGSNIEHYPLDLSDLVLTEPNRAMHALLAERVKKSGRKDIRLASARAEELYYPDQSFDSVVATLVLCTVPDPKKCLQEFRRILRPGGQFFFLEHVRGKSGWTIFRQCLMEPVSRFLGCGCSLLRDSATVIRQAGFRMEEFEEFLDLGGSIYDQHFIVGRATL